MQRLYHLFYGWMWMQIRFSLSHMWPTKTVKNRTQNSYPK